MNEILELQGMPVETVADPLGVLKTSSVRVHCTSGRTTFIPGDE